MPLDAIALAWFVAAWLGYNLSFDYLLRRPESLNRYMRTVRHFWMARMIERDNRIADAALLGHLIHNVSFFASTTLLVLAGLLGVIGTLDDIFGAVADLGVMVETTQALFEFKVLLLVAIFIF